MTIEQIGGAAAVIVGLTGEDFDLAVAIGLTRVRHQQVYQSFNWKAAEDIITLPVEAENSLVEVPNAENVISARWEPTTGTTNYLDSVSETYLFESLPELVNEANGLTGVPLYYVSRFNPDTQAINLRITPTPNADGTLVLLIKRKFAAVPQSSEPLIPNIDEVLLQFVISDLWQYIRQVGMSGQILTEAKALLAAAQARDIPTVPKPRTSKNLTSSGDTLSEMTDAVCDIIGRWEPDIRESVRDRIRRNHKQLHDTLMLPESLVIANVQIEPEQEQVVLPAFFDRVLEVRTNSGGPLTQITPLKNREISYYFNVDKDIFERSGEPLFYSMLSNVAVEALSPFNEAILVSSDANNNGDPLTPHPRGNPDAGAEILVKGLSLGKEYTETLTISAGLGSIPGPLYEDSFWKSLASTAHTYDEPLTISKPDTVGSVTFYGGSSHTELLTLAPKEREKKCLRIWILPNKNPQDTVGDAYPTGSVLVLGKRRVSPLIKDLDSPLLRNVSGILINAAAGDMFDRLGNAEQSAKYSAKAAAQAQTLTDAETKQNAFHPIITPYADSGDDELDF